VSTEITGFTLRDIFLHSLLLNSGGTFLHNGFLYGMLLHHEIKTVYRPAVKRLPDDTGTAIQ